MNFTLDSYVATLILVVSLTYFAHSVLVSLPRDRHCYDDSLVVLGRLLRHYDFQIAIYTNNLALIDAVVYSTINAHHDYYITIVDTETKTIVSEHGTLKLSSYLVSVTLPGWNGTLKPRTLCFRVGVRG